MDSNKCKLLGIIHDKASKKIISQLNAVNIYYDRKITLGEFKIYKELFQNLTTSGRKITIACIGSMINLMNFLKLKNGKELM